MNNVVTTRIMLLKKLQIGGHSMLIYCVLVLEGVREVLFIITWFLPAYG